MIVPTVIKRTLLILCCESCVCTTRNDFPYRGCAIGLAHISRLYVTGHCTWHNKVVAICELTATILTLLCGTTYTRAPIVVVWLESDTHLDKRTLRNICCFESLFKSDQHLLRRTNQQFCCVADQRTLHDSSYSAPFTKRKSRPVGRVPVTSGGRAFWVP